MSMDVSVFDGMDAASFEALETRVERLLAAWEVQNLRGGAAIFHDDQHIGQKRREVQAVGHPAVDVAALQAFRMKAVVDSLEGNMLIHPLTSPVVEVNADATQARAVFWSLGVEGLSKFREEPMAIISLGMVPGNHVRMNGEWRILSGAWQRTTKNEYKKGWVRDMQQTNTRPPLTPEQDRNFLGKYAYRKDETRKPSPEPPRKDTFEQFPEETDMNWLYVNLNAGK